MALFHLPASIIGFPIFEKQDLCTLQMRHIRPFSFLPSLVPNCVWDGNSQLTIASCLLLVGSRYIIKILPTKACYGPKVPSSAATQGCDSAPGTRKEEAPPQVAIQSVSGNTVYLHSSRGTRQAQVREDKLESIP